MNDLQEFIKTLELAESTHTTSFPEILTGLEADEVDSGFVNFKSLQSFVAGVSENRQADVLNSLLLAQRAATKAFPDQSQMMEWYQKYFSVLETIGWVFENKDFNTFETHNTLFDIDKAILEILGTAVTGNQLAILLKTIETFKKLGEDDDRFRFFESNTHTLQKGSFQVGVATEENNTISISGCAFVLTTSKKITKILFFTSGKDESEFSFCFTKATLNDAVFANARDAIKQKLGDVSSFVADLEI